MRFMQEQWPIQIISDTYHLYDEPPDFRTPGEKRRDARQAASRRKAEARKSIEESYLPFELSIGSDEPSAYPGRSLAYHGSRALRAMERARVDKRNIAKWLIELIALELEKAGTPGQVANLLLSASLITGGLTTMTVAVAIGIGTLVEDIVTGGAGVADDPVSFEFAMFLFILGKEMYDEGLIVFEIARRPFPPPAEPEPDA